MPQANDRQVGGCHYSSPVQVWDFIHRNNIGYLAGNIIKYVSRYKSKNGMQDLYKAQHYIEKLIEEEEEAYMLNEEERVFEDDVRAEVQKMNEEDQQSHYAEVQAARSREDV